MNARGNGGAIKVNAIALPEVSLLVPKALPAGPRVLGPMISWGPGVSFGPGARGGTGEGEALRWN